MSPRKRTGAVVRRGERWVARITLHREPLTESGEQRHCEVNIVRPGKTPIDESWARDFAYRLQVRYDEGKWQPKNAKPRADVETVEQWVDLFLSEQTYSEASKDRRRVKEWLPRTKLAKFPIEQVDGQAIAEFLKELASLKSLKTGLSPAPRTQRNVVDPISRSLRHAVFMKRLAADPFAVVPTELRPQAIDADPTKRAGFRLTREQVTTLLDDPGIEDRWQTLWTILAFTGTRISEAIALRWMDLQKDEPLGRVVVAAQIHHRTRERVPTKTDGVADVPLHPVLAARLAWWRKEGWLAEYGREPGSGDFLVPSRGKPGRPWGTAEGSGGPLWQQDVHRALQRDLEACGIKNHRVHDFRHTFASLCADAGMAAEVASRWTHTPITGNKSSARSLYVHPSWARQCEEMLRLDIRPRWFSGKGE